MIWLILEKRIFFSGMSGNTVCFKGSLLPLIDIKYQLPYDILTIMPIELLIVHVMTKSENRRDIHIHSFFIPMMPFQHVHATSLDSQFVVPA